MPLREPPLGWLGFPDALWWRQNPAQGEQAAEVCAGAARSRVGGAVRDERRWDGDPGGLRGRPRWRQRRQEEGLSGVRGLAGAPYYQGYGVAGLSPGGPSAAPATRRRPLTRGRAAGRAPAASGLRQAGGGGPWPGCAPFSPRQVPLSNGKPTQPLLLPCRSRLLWKFILLALSFWNLLLCLTFYLWDLSMLISVNPLYSFPFTAL